MTEFRARAWLAAWVAGLLLTAGACGPEVVAIQPWMVDVFSYPRLGAHPDLNEMYRFHFSDDGTVEYFRDPPTEDAATFLREWEPLDENSLVMYAADDEPRTGPLEPGAEYSAVLTRGGVCGPHDLEHRNDGVYAGRIDFFTGELCVVVPPCDPEDCCCDPFEVVLCEGASPPPPECID